MYINKYIDISFIDILYNIYMWFNNTMAENCQVQTTYLTWFKKCQKCIVDCVCTRYQTAIIAHIYYDLVRLLRIQVQQLKIQYYVYVYKFYLQSVTEITDKNIMISLYLITFILLNLKNLNKRVFKLII